MADFVMAIIIFIIEELIERNFFKDQIVHSSFIPLFQTVSNTEPALNDDIIAKPPHPPKFLEH
jgi:hypothetical protein